MALRMSPCCALVCPEPAPPVIVSLPVAASSTLTMVCAAEVKLVHPPAASVLVAVTRMSRPTRDWAEVLSC